MNSQILEFLIYKINNASETQLIHIMIKKKISVI